ncbi:MAG: hypothetical protein HQK72_07045 [Desulfamplus sp.]|nr:hypothetical protein [Desulfamplus sp.]
MNDFLQSIRGNQKDKRPPKTRRSFDNSNFNTTPNFTTQNFQNQGNYQSTRSGNTKRPNTRVSPHAHFHGDDTQPQPPYSPQLNPFDVMLDLLDSFTKNQEMMISVQEKRIIAEERKAIALEEIAEYLRVMTMPSFQEKFRTNVGDMRSEEPILSDIDESDFDGENLQKTSKVNIELKQDKFSNIDNTLESLSSKDVQEPIEGEIVDDIDDEQNINIENSYSEDVEYSIKGVANKDLEDETNIEQQPIKVIRRKKAENREEFLVSIEEDSEKFVKEEELSSAKIDILQNRPTATDKDNLTNREAPNRESALVDQENDEKKLLSREEIIEIINSMRAKGKTFDEVAQHLIDLGQPTFSGRGVWHAQTIHRICTRDEKKSQKNR